MPHGIGEISVLSEPWTSENPQTGIARKAAHAARDLGTRHQKIPLKNEFDTHFFSFTSRLSFPNTLLRPAVAEGVTEERGLTLWKGCSTPARAESSQGGTTGQSCSAGTGNKDSLHSTTEPLGAEIPPLGQGMLLD